MKKHATKRLIFFVIIIIIVIIVIAVGWIIITPRNHSVPTAISVVPSFPTHYASTQDGFSINYSGNPEVTDTTFSSPTAGSIPLTRYKESAANGTPGAYYEVSVYHYPSNYKFATGYLNGALQDFYKTIDADFPGAQIISSQATQFLGNSAISASISIPGATTPYNDYLIIIIKGHNVYIISTYGLSQIDYSTFASAFKFTQ